MNGQMPSAAATSATPFLSPGDKKPTSDTAGPAFSTVLQGHLDHHVAGPGSRNAEPVGRAVVEDPEQPTTNEATSKSSDADTESAGSIDMPDLACSTDPTALDANTGVVHLQVAVAADQLVLSAVVTAARVANTPSATPGAARAGAESDPERAGVVEHHGPAGALLTTSVEVAATDSASTDSASTSSHLSRVNVPTPPDTGSTNTAIGLPRPAASAPITLPPDAEATALMADQSLVDGPNVLDRAALHRLGGVSRLGMDVVTDELGAIRIDVADRRGILEVNMRADEFPTRVLLSGRLHELRQELSDSGIDVGSFGVAQGDADQRNRSRAHRTLPNSDSDPARPPQDGTASSTPQAATDELAGAGRVDVQL
ncbi:MAG: hypothetical protein ACI83Y_002834 [Candidatus Azotimanducaceae bacterium]|jgi:hypothetical protein